jgi:sigma-B regulation protein RsbU (phosphoserine phosphatase)
MWRAESGQAEFWDVKQGPALSICDDAEFPTSRGRLAEGDKMLIYTDGLIETCSPDNEEFGEENVQRVLTNHGRAGCRRILEQIDHEAERWRQRPQPEDDTLLIMLARPNGNGGEIDTESDA